MRSLKLVVVLALCFAGVAACGKKVKTVENPVQNPVKNPIQNPADRPGYVNMSQEAMLERYFASDYSLCDAHFVGKAFGFDLRESKVYIGQKITWDTTDILDGSIGRAREQGQTDRLWRCQFYQTGFSYDDAYALAQMWGMDVSNAKVRIEDKILWGNERYLRDELLPEARAMDGGNEAAYQENIDDQAAELAAFHESKYDICHARMLIGTYFGDTMSETKQLIGYKAGAGYTDIIDSKLSAERAAHRAAGTLPCQFYQTPYTASDAEALAALWGGSISDVKSLVESKYLFGSESLIAIDLRQARENH